MGLSQKLASQTKTSPKNTSAIQDQQKKLASQQTQHKQSLSESAVSKNPKPAPWKRDAVPPKEKRLGQDADKPGPQAAKDRIQNSVRNRTPQPHQNLPTGPGEQAAPDGPGRPDQNVRQPKESRILQVLEALFGDTKIMQDAHRKAQKMRMLMDALKKKPRQPQPYNPAMQQQIAQQVPVRDQRNAALKQGLAQRKNDLTQSKGKEISPRADTPQQQIAQQKPAQQKPTPADQKPKKDLSAFKKNKEVGPKQQSLTD